MIREASGENWPAIEPLLRAMGFADGQTSEQLRDRFLDYAGRADHCLVVAEDEAGLAGYAWAQDLGFHLRSGDSTVRLHDLWVEEGARRRGHGRALFTAVREWSEQRGARWLGWHGGARSASFYASLGLEPIPSEDETHPFYEIEFR